MVGRWEAGRRALLTNTVSLTSGYPHQERPKRIPAHSGGFGFIWLDKANPEPEHLLLSGVKDGWSSCSPCRSHGQVQFPPLLRSLWLSCLHQGGMEGQADGLGTQEDKGSPVRLREVALRGRLPCDCTCIDVLMVPLLLLRPPGSHYCSAAAVMQLGHGDSSFLHKEPMQLRRRWLPPHPLRLSREAEEGGPEVRWRQSCGKSDQDPAHTCWNWVFNRAVLEVTPYQCGPAILAGQRSSDTEINEKALHNVTRSGSYHR